MKKIICSSKEEAPKRWGKWMLDEKNFSLPLFLCNSPEVTLGWITSIHEKEWTTNQDIGDLFEALNDLLNIKGYFDRNGYEHDNENIEYTRNVVQQRIRLNKIKIINKGG